MMHAGTLTLKNSSHEATLWQAVCARDVTFDGHFVFAVMTTGIFCRPSCRARRALPQNVRFFEGENAVTAAQEAGFRACLRCQPDRAIAPSVPVRCVIDAAEALTRAVACGEPAPDLATLAARAGYSLAHFHKLFRASLGVTPRAFAARLRTDRVVRAVTEGASVTDAIIEAGYSGPGRFYASTGARNGVRARGLKGDVMGEQIEWAQGTSSLGPVLVAATQKGVCAIEFGEDSASLHARLVKRFPRAQIMPASANFAKTIRTVVALIDGSSTAADIPLDVRGTAFQQRVWQALHAIPSGTSLSYGELARAIGSPTASRAVARACATNMIAVVVPCHRVVGASGALTGYRWGVERKRALLEREQNQGSLKFEPEA